MTRLQRIRSALPLGFIIFAALVIVSGLALSAAGYLSNPFNSISRLAAQLTGSDTGFAAPEGFEERTPPAGREAGAMPAGGEGFTQATSLLGEIAWSQVGGVLYNLWLMAAASLVVMIISRPLGMVMRRLKGSRRPARAAS